MPTHHHYGNPGATLPQDVQDRVIELAQQGWTRNAIVRELHISNASVSGIAKRAGITFDRTRVAAATAAKTADMQARRKGIASRLLDEATQLLDEMHRPHLTFNIGGKDNVYTEHQLKQPPVEAKRHLMMAASTALQRHIDLERHDADQGSENAKSMLAELGRALGIRPVDDSP